MDARNRDSRFNLSRRISYPNERDKKGAKELGVSPGGDIMIHGIKNGFSWVGDAHAEVDWTKGCIAVTNEEIEEIAKVAPNGTIVEIRPYDGLPLVLHTPGRVIMRVHPIFDQPATARVRMNTLEDFQIPP